jgi:hypothetical protein
MIVFVIFSVEVGTELEIPIHKTVLMLGSSQIECAINDNILDEAFNLCESGDSYFASYLKLQKLHNDNDHIETVYLGYHSMSLAENTDKWYNIDYDDKFETLWWYNSSELLNLYSNVAIFRKLLSVSTFIAALRYVYFGSISEYNIGGYLYLVRNKLEEDLSRRCNEKNRPKLLADTQGYKFSDNQIIYLQKIISYCEQNSLDLILFDTPQYGEGVSSFSFYKKYYDQHLSNIQWLDYSRFKLDKSCYGDVIHLNNKGAELFSKYLNTNGIDACNRIQI